MEANPNRVEAERLLGISEKLLQSRDLNGSRDFAILAQETEPLLDGSDQIIAVVEVLLSSENRVNNHNNWYSILQVDCQSGDLESIKKQYRKLALLLHPDKNKFAWADHAFRLVAEAWAVLSNPLMKSKFDNELSSFTKVDLNDSNITQHSKLPVRRNAGQDPQSFTPFNKRSVSNDGFAPPRVSTFWTACPYCYRLYEYPTLYEECCLRCQSCKRAFHGAIVPSLPPMVPGKEAYYCCWGFFPLGFVMGNSESGGGKESSSAFPNWNPPVFPSVQKDGPPTGVGSSGIGAGVGTENVTVSGNRPTSAFPSWNQPIFSSVQGGSSGVGAENLTVGSMKTSNALNSFSNGGAGAGSELVKKKRGRPRKNLVV